ncbi:MAG: hypothetical protein ACRETB_05840, partial [Steroidobacteraceae bacterium]
MANEHTMPTALEDLAAPPARKEQGSTAPAAAVQRSAVAPRLYILTTRCPDTTGIVAGIAGFLAA